MKPRPYQAEAKQSIFQYFGSGKTGNPVVAMPTATGKSFVIADFVKDVLTSWPNQRIIVATHVKELIQGNSDTLKEIWPLAPYGIYSAGLNRREANHPIVFAGVQSMVADVDQFGWRDLMLIDEAHLLGPSSDSRYAQVIARLRAINPAMKVIGFTATPYRLGQGLLTDGENPLFTDICYDITGMKQFNKLISDGFLCPPIGKKTATKIDISNVGIGSDGDYNKGELEKASDIDAINKAACKEMVEYGADRKAWITFASGIDHAEHIAEILRSYGVPTVAVHSKMKNGARDKTFDDLKRGKIRGITNNNCVTTGINHPPFDLCGMLRATTSPGLLVQMIGRLMRLSPGKENALILDFAGNIARLGPVNDPLIPRPRSKGAPGVAPVKICPQCGTYNHATARVCEFCQMEFPINVNLASTAGEDEPIRSDLPQMEWFNVQRVNYTRVMANGRPFLRATYICGIRAFSENLFFEDKQSFPLHKAHQWWRIRMGTEEVPPTVLEALNYVALLQVPSRIYVWLNKRYPEIIKVEGLRRLVKQS